VEVLALHDKSTAWMPVPDNWIAAGELVASLVRSTTPLAAPPTAGANVIWNEAACPGSSVKGTLDPEMLNGPPGLLAWEIVTASAPEFVAFTDIAPVLSTTTFPKLALFGLTVNRRVTPVPDKAAVTGESAAVLLKDADPVKFPAAVGVKATANAALWPAPSTNGNDGPVMLNPDPLTLSPATATGTIPLLVSVTVSLLLLPAKTLPKLTLAGETAHDAKPCALRPGVRSAIQTAMVMANPSYCCFIVLSTAGAWTRQLDAADFRCAASTPLS
jgi:hypothetical protein